jgi:nicotinamidase-related amidase
MAAMNDSLIDSNDSVLIVIDVQAEFLNKLPATESETLTQQIGWLIGVAKWLNIPLVVTAEDIPKLGSISPEIERVLPSGTPVYNKMTFGLAAEPTILTAVARTARKTAVLIGLETDVCVAQSAIGLIEQGYRVIAIADATGSPGTAHEFGLERIRGAGGLVMNVKSLFYEWMRKVERVQQFHAEYSQVLVIPESLQL